MMENTSLRYNRKPYQNVEISEEKKTLSIPYIKDKSKYSIFQQILLIIVIIFFCCFYIPIYQLKKVQKKNSSFLNILLTSLKNESLSINSQITKIETLLQTINKNQNLLRLNKNVSNSEFIKLLSSLHNLKRKVQQPKTNTEKGLLISFLTAPRLVVGKKKIRLGKNRDGGYVLLDDFKDIKIAYSIGISNILDFDKALADKGIDVYMYDHTINKLPFDNIKFHWFKKGLCSNNTRKNNLITLTEMMKQNGHLNESNMILKIDVEGPEWETFNELSEEILNKFKYILGEFHWFKQKIMIEGKSEIIFNVLKKLNKTHQVFHKHCHCIVDAFILGEYYFSDAIELSFIKREGYEFENDYSIYPIDGLDFSNSPTTKNKQIFLGMAGLFGFK